MQIHISKPQTSVTHHAEQALAEAKASLSTPSQTLNGRGDIYLYDKGPKPWLVKKYRRGGLIAKLINERYVSNPFTPSRMLAELNLLEQLNALALPVPKPIAAGVNHIGPFYQGMLVMEYLSNTQTLASKLLQAPIDKALWQDIGKTLRNFHEHQVFHADLNATNIMLDSENSIYLIDFDKSKLKTGESWKAKNLNRLQRSLNKIKQANSNLHYQPSDWQQLLKGYHQLRL